MPSVVNMGLVGPDLMSRFLCDGGHNLRQQSAIDECCAKHGRQANAGASTPVLYGLLHPRAREPGLLHARAREPGDAAENDPENKAGHGGHDEESMRQ